MSEIIYSLFIIVLFLFSFLSLITISLFILIGSGLPVFYHQKRIGMGGKPFEMYKFRTMAVGADDLKNKYRSLNEADGPVFKIRNDPRFTKIGRFLSHTGLDELPQIWNVLRGDMALIGPRPLPVEEEKKLKTWMKKRETIKPGIISPWVLEGYHSKSFDEWMKSDTAYIRNKSLSYDAKFLLKTNLFMLHLLFSEIGLCV